MKYTIDEFIAAAEQELEAWKDEGEKKRTDFDYEKLGFVRAVSDRLQSNRQNIGKHLGKCSAIVTDDELNEVWGNANFGAFPKRYVIIEALKKVAQAWGTGHTAMCIVKELGLVESRNGQYGLSDKGLMYLLASV